MISIYDLFSKNCFDCNSEQVRFVGPGVTLLDLNNEYLTICDTLNNVKPIELFKFFFYFLSMKMECAKCSTVIYFRFDEKSKPNINIDYYSVVIRKMSKDRSPNAIGFEVSENGVVIPNVKVRSNTFARVKPDSEKKYFIQNLYIQKNYLIN
ncbi:MAG: hypothetical protein LC122_11645 [Chitinophagales bacterium]|nr:hypothetical protein [Chitinophagales bacterium]